MMIPRTNHVHAGMYCVVLSCCYRNKQIIIIVTLINSPEGFSGLFTMLKYIVNLRKKYKSNLELNTRIHVVFC